MKIILIVLCFLLTGCKIDYNLKITNDNKFVENADLSKYFPDGSSFIDETGTYTYNFADELKNDAYGYLNELGYSRYSISDITSKNYEGVRVTRTYDTFNSYNYNLLVKNLYDDFSVSSDNSIITISAKGFNRENIESKYEMIGMEIGNSSINVELPYKVLENNADSVDENHNIYTWYIDKDTVSKDLLLKYDTNDIYALNMNTIGVKVNINIIYLVLALIIIIVISYFGYIYIKKVYENRNKI